MAQSAAPRGTRALTLALIGALDKIPAEHRKAAFRHASTAVKEKLAKDADKAKAAAAKARPAKATVRKPAARKAAALARGRAARSADTKPAARPATTSRKAAPERRIGAAPARSTGRKRVKDAEARTALADGVVPVPDQEAADAAATAE